MNQLIYLFIFLFLFKLISYLVYLLIYLFILVITISKVKSNTIYFSFSDYFLDVTHEKVDKNEERLIK